MQFCLWNEGAPVLVRPGQARRIGGKTVMIGTAPDPALGLYAYVETGPRPNRYQYAGNTDYSLDGDTVTATRSVIDKPVAQVAAQLKAEIKARRNRTMDGGMVWSPDGGATLYPVQTDASSRRNLHAERDALAETGEAETAWRMADNIYRVLATDDFAAMVLAVRAHVKACYARHAELEATIDATAAAEGATVADLLALDLESGWPETYQPETAEE